MLLPAFRARKGILMNRILIATMVLVALATCPAVLAQDPEYVVSFSETAGPTGSEQTVICLFDNPDAVDDINGWQLAVCHDAMLVEVISAENGETTNTVNNGTPPELGFITILPGESLSRFRCPGTLEVQTHCLERESDPPFDLCAADRIAVSRLLYGGPVSVITVL